MRGKDCQETLGAAETGASERLSVESARGEADTFSGVIKNTWQAISVDNLRQRKARKLRRARQKGNIWGSKMVPNFALETCTRKRM